MFADPYKPLLRCFQSASIISTESSASWPDRPVWIRIRFSGWADEWIVVTDSISEGLACEKDSVSCNSLCCAHRVRDRARKVRPMDRDRCDGDAVVESRGPSPTLSWGIAKARSQCFHLREI